jgi:hypothetical protein
MDTVQISRDPLPISNGLATRLGRERRNRSSEFGDNVPPSPMLVKRQPTADAITLEMRQRILAAAELEPQRCRLPAALALPLMFGLAALLWLVFDDILAAAADVGALLAGPMLS